ncbi:MAG: citrate transporter [Clostridia bacterium]|nr:citrate transporter [Clostridia bacterium]MBQ7075351.1 citrate transporter [Clostridia bacterium]
MAFIKKNFVMCIAFVLAIITCFIIPPDKSYIDYFDFKTLACLFCTLACVCALKNIKFFRIVSEKIVVYFKTARSAVIALVYITFIGSMLLANDMALITFLPLGYYVLKSTDNFEYMNFTFIMQNIAANLGGMLTPFGNPQNLYLYSYYHIQNGEFIKIMFLPFIISVVLITACCFKIPNKPLLLVKETDVKLNVKRAVIYGILFVLSILLVFRIVPYITGLVIITALIFILDRTALKKVDYPLLLTFVAFFVFAGNMARIPAVNAFLGGLVNKNTLLYGVLSCQVMSNVPSAVLLSKFTTNYPALLVAVNIGGAGTLIASLASLITFREYIKRQPTHALSYLKKFTFYNVMFLIILYFIMSIVL